MATQITESAIRDALELVYDKAVNGVVGMDSALDMANDFSRDGDDPIEQANSLIRWQIAKASASGFVTGLGGLLVLPVTVPVNLFTVIYVQVRMVAAIAHMGGYDLKDDRVKTLVYSCLVTNSAAEVLKDVGIAIGHKMAMNAVKQISIETIRKVNKAVGFKLLTKFGEKGVINLGKAIPILGGLIGGSVDAYSTNMIGNIARDTFIGKKPATDTGGTA